MLLRLRFAGAVLSLVVCWGALVLYLEWFPTTSLLRHYHSPAAPSPASLRHDARPPSATTTTLGHGRLVDAASTAEEAAVVGGGAHVLVVGDSGSLGGLVAAVNSVLVHSSHHVTFYLLTSPEEMLHLRTWIQSSKLHSMSYTILPGMSKAQLHVAKTLVPQLLPRTLSSLVLYLDPDVIVQGDVWELVSTSVGAGHLGAFSRDCSSRAQGWAGPWDTRLSAAGVDPTACPLATGAFVVDVGAWRSHNVTERLQHWLAVLRREPAVGPHSALDEVDLAMSIVLEGQVSSLHALWHVQHLGVSSGSRHSKQFVERAKLLRWSSRAKPWLPRAAHAEVWERYLVPDPTGQFHPIRKRG